MFQASKLLQKTINALKIAFQIDLSDYFLSSVCLFDFRWSLSRKHFLGVTEQKIYFQ